jgi:hypothetical protein
VTRSSILVVAVLISACATFRSAPPEFSGAWPPIDGGPRPAIVLVVSGSATVDGWPRDPGPVLDLWGAASERAYRESALFSDVSVAEGRGDLRVEIAIQAHTHQVEVLTALSYLTLLVLPHVVTTDIAVVTRVVADDDEPAIGTMEVRGRSRTWHQLLLFPIASLYEPAAVTPEIVYDLNRETISTLHARGVF